MRRAYTRVFEHVVIGIALVAGFQVGEDSPDRRTNCGGIEATSE